MTNSVKRKVGVRFGLLLLLGIRVVAAQEMHPLMIEDCVRTRRIVQEEVQISGDGTLAAYVVKAPDVIANRNKYELYVRDLRQTARREDGHLLLQADKISRIKWLDHERIVAQAERTSEDGKMAKREVIILDITSEKQEVLPFPVTPESYSISANGDTVVFSTKTDEEGSSSEIAGAKLREREARGYRVVYGNGSGTEIESFHDDYEIYLGRRTPTTGKFEFSKLYFTGFEGSTKRSLLRGVYGLQLSPNGKLLLLRYTTDKLPPDMEGNPLIQLINRNGTNAASRILALYDIEAGTLRFDFHYPGVVVEASWANDSRAYTVTGPSPLDSEDGLAESEAAMAANARLLYSYRFSHVFTVDAKTGAVTKVLNRDSGWYGAWFLHDLPLEWQRSDGEMLVRADEENLVRMGFRNGQWQIRNRFEFRRKGFFDYFPSSDGRVLLGISQSSTIPPDLVLLKMGTQERVLLTDLNAEFRQITLGQVRKIEWTNGYGTKCKGRLIQPTGYKAGKRYPLIVIANDFDEDYFISDSPYTTAFAPQSLANAGFLVLMSKYTTGDKIPKDRFPGEMGMAYDWMSMVESAINLLSEWGMADKNNVGIVGFSRTSWLTDFTLTHSSYKFTAASSADGGLYTYGGYYRLNFLRQMAADETQIGGPPYGKTLAYWLEYAAPFNADRVQAPVLMEWTGPLDPVLEFFVALARQGKPVELYHYPKGDHPLDTPLERVASLERNVDWLRFWMQGYERTNPEDPEQYVRWRAMREGRDISRGEPAATLKPR